jgi:hypothetical protein
MTRIKDLDALSPEEREQRLAFHHYPTPSQFVRHALRYMMQRYPIRTDATILDHSAGTGVWNAVWGELLPDSYRVNVELQVATPIRIETAHEWHYGDRFQDWARNEEREFHVISGNMPFFEAQEFVEIAYKLLPPDGIHIALLPSNFLSTQDRTVTLHRVLTPEYVITIPKRLSFTKDGKTDNKEYMLFVWRKGFAGDYASLDFHFDWAMDAPDLPEDVIFQGAGLDMVQAPLWDGMAR